MSDTKQILADLVSFDTTSRNSNLELVSYVETYLARFGVASRRIPDLAGHKANLWATIGEYGDGGIILSGHTDCVPVDGQAWSTEPYALTEKDGRLYGRGACDMKGFLASVLAAVPEISRRKLSRPVHIAMSYDEETGCIGVRPLITEIARLGCRPSACIVGEPTSMGVVTAHKGGRAYRCSFEGLEAHSSLSPRGVNAIQFAARLVAIIDELGETLALGPHDPDFDVGHSTISTNMIEGGSAINIVPRACSFEFEFRNTADIDPDVLFDRIQQHADEVLLPLMRRKHPGASIRFEQIYEYPAFEIQDGHPLVKQARDLTGCNSRQKVAFGTEAGLFQRDLALPTIVCGPGSIALAHRPDEYVTIADLGACDAFIRAMCV
ncbi:acetylornithine deacetylase [Pseudaminobacter soli (ex Li et al. 2025)]|uniref:acetylornithine deacetylase n=1 Tax=Pseudaminobacter soli (ex Li et al. 2025) TaxID=1295366 RepID=UPI0024762BF3|nr:acetylornithine deacetylase [Mesorhizobium soli]